MRFYNSRRTPGVTAEHSPRSPGLLPRRVRAWIDGVLDLAQDVSHTLDAFAGVARYAVEQVDRSVPPEASETSESEPRSAGPVAVDLGLALRVSELERAVERLDGPEVAWSGETGHPCLLCGCTRAERLRGASVSGDFVYARCAECRAVGPVLVVDAGPQEVLP